MLHIYPPSDEYLLIILSHSVYVSPLLCINFLIFCLSLLIMEQLRSIEETDKFAYILHISLCIISVLSQLQVLQQNL